MSERVVEPLEMSDTEILDWLNEYCGTMRFYPATVMQNSMYEIDCFYGSFYGDSVRDVTCTAATRQREREGV